MKVRSVVLLMWLSSEAILKKIDGYFSNVFDVDIFIQICRIQGNTRKAFNKQSVYKMTCSKRFELTKKIEE
jgi:hypothetical protein